jgi:PAS domain S-box-containing protein
VTDPNNPNDVAAEHESLLHFLYLCPYGLAQFDRSGAISLCNPAFSRLAMPLVPVGRGLDNLISVLLPALPALPDLLQNPIASGMLCDGQRVAVYRPGSPDPRTLALTLVRLDPEEHMALLSDVTDQVTQERRMREIEEEAVQVRIAEVENKALAAEIREQKRAKELLRLSESRYRRLFEASEAGILVVDAADGTIVDANPALLGLLDYSFSDVVGKHLWDVAAFAAVVADRMAFVALQRQRFLRHSDIPLRTKDDRVVDVELVSLIYVEQGRETIQWNIRDITERKAAERLMVQAQKMTAVGILTGGVAHNINNLLGVIIGNLDLLRQQPSQDETDADYTNEALEAAQHGAALVRQMLAFAREQPLQMQRVDIHDMVSRIAKTFGAILGEDVRVTLNFGEDMCWPVLSDPSQLEASIMNLVVNAREAMPDGGLLTISACNRRLGASMPVVDVTIPGDYVEIAITDTGIGMSDATRERIFDPFFSTKGLADKPGTGLGLSTVFGFMKQSGGTIGVDSVVGRGTTLKLYLPRLVGDREEDAPTIAASVKAGSETVLMVEDNPALCRVVARQLDRLGYRVLQAFDAHSAMAMLEQEPVDLLFTDLILPDGVDGLALMRWAHKRWPKLKVVLTTGSGDAPSRDESRDLYVLPKPYLMVDLARVLREAFDMGSAGDC